MMFQHAQPGEPGGDVRSPEPLPLQIAEKPLAEWSEPSMGPKVLIIDDDIALGKFLSRKLRRRHFSVEVGPDGEAACSHIYESAYDLVILDLNLPKMDGMAILQKVRLSKPRLPILVLTARNRREDLLLALEQGADDYLIKPFSFMELLARVRSLLRRNSNPIESDSSSKIGNLSINREEHTVMRGERRIDLTVREFALLEYLMNNVGKAVSRATLMREVWNLQFDSTTNIVDVYMKYLRDKIDLDGEEKLIRTVRGVGYVLRND
jgi:DNA-binding response OmpR family regulator